MIVTDMDSRGRGICLAPTGQGEFRGAPQTGQIWKVLLARMAILWYSLLRQSRNALRLGYEGIFYRPGPMQAEPANLVRRGTEQP